MNRPHPTSPPVPLVRQRARHATIGFYIAAAILYWISLYLYVPTLPTYVQTKTDSLALVGTVLSMYGLWQAVIRLPLGIAADWLGRRKPFIVAGLALAALGAWFLGVGKSPTGLLVGRSITGLAAASWVPMVVAFSSLFPPHEAVRATAMLSFANSGGRILATSLTGTLNTWGGYTLPFFLAAGAAGLGILCILPTREKKRPRLTPSPGRITHLLTRHDVLLPSLLAAVGEYAIWSTTFGFSPILAQQLGGSDIIQSMLVTMNLAAVIVGNLSATVLASRVGVRRLVLFSFLMLAGGVGLTATATSLPVLFAAQLLIGLSNGVSFPVLMGLSIRYVGDPERNTAMGLFQSVYALGKFSGPWCSGMLAQAVGLRWMLAFTAVGTLGLGLLGASRLGEEDGEEGSPRA